MVSPLSLIAFALVAVWLRRRAFPMAPMLLGFILGGLLEDNLRRSLIISDGNLSYLLDRPISLVLATLIFLALIAPLAQKLIRGTFNARS